MYYDVLKSGARVNCQTSTPSLYDTVLSSLGLFEYSPTSLQNQVNYASLIIFMNLFVDDKVY